MKYLIILSCALLSIYSVAQDFNILISGEVKSKGSLTEIYPINSGEFYTTRVNRGFKRNIVNLEYYNDFELQIREKAPYRVNGSIGLLEDLKVIDKVPYCFLSDKTNKTRTLFALRMDQNMSVTSESIRVIEDPVQRQNGNNRNFIYVQSKNQKYLAVFVNISLKDDVNDIYKYVILDKDLTILNKGEFSCVTPREQTIRSNSYLSDNGNLYLANKEYQLDDERRIIKTYNKLVGMHLYRVGEKPFKHQYIDLTTKVVTETSILQMENGMVALSGMYRNIDKATNSGIDGIFYAELNMAQDKINTLSYEYFDRDFITDGWTEREKSKARKREQKGKGEPKLFNYKLRELQYDSVSKSLTGIAEQYYVAERTSVDARGYSTTTYIYYYNTLVVYKIDHEGKFVWTKKIPKLQVSTNDGGITSSITNFSSNGKMVILYNDTQDNYDFDGNYVTENLKSSTTSTRKHTVTSCIVDLKTGDFKRKQLEVNAENSYAILIPKLCKPNTEQTELTIYLSGKRGDRFGYIRY